MHISGADDEYGRGVKKGDQSASGPGAKTLLEQVDGRLGSWKDGILTIGTFGYDPLITQQQRQEEDTKHHDLIPYFQGGGSHDGIEDEGDGYGCDSSSNNNDNGIIAHHEYEDDEELNPLIHPELRGSYIEKEHHCQAVVKVAVIGMDMDIVSSSSSSSRRNIPDPKREIKGERTTLADLFSADSADTGLAKSWKAINSSGKNRKTKKELEEEEEEASTKKKVHAAHLFSKKFIPHMSHGSRPMKKLHKVIIIPFHASDSTHDKFFLPGAPFLVKRWLDSRVCSWRVWCLC